MPAHVCILTHAIAAFSSWKAVLLQEATSRMWVRFSPVWNGVVGKLRDSRGRKEIGEIPQDVVRGSSPLPHRKASSFPATPEAHPK
ncbi:hypothetical protein DYE48_13320 [Halobacillus trueperi]|uniref:Uncharacterized protein n=1 Tax=Halobacillus trueperi TaxID=156205 RepID=A0A3E0J716_9BACI|nr:hypothetical protein DYE48_13320 [Halobacillus trueperi]